MKEDGPAAAGQDAVEASLRASEDRYRALFEVSPDAILVHREGRILLANPAAAAFFGFDQTADLVGYRVLDLVHPAERANVIRRLRALRTPGARVPLVVERLQTRDGRERWGEVAAANVDYAGDQAVQVVVRDVTTRNQLEEQLRRAQRLEAVGRLAGGIAHDFNNLLTAIGGYARLLLDETGPADPRREATEEIISNTERAARLTRQLLAFSRQQVLQPEDLDIEAVARAAAGLLRPLLDDTIDIVVHARPGLGRVRADRVQIEQVLLNLGVNARDAMPGGGTLAFELANARVEPEEAETYPYRVLPGDYVELSVSDTGIGIPSEVQPYIFEPFYTTKPQGRGTGLGLATVYGIVKQSRGYIWTESEEGRGARFRIYLPRVDSPQDPSVTEVPSDRDEDRMVEDPRAWTILVVEDETAVRDLVRRVIDRAGFTVLEARSAGEAVALAAASDRPIDLLVTDIVMPDMTGPELAARLIPANAGMRVLLTSGYALDTIPEGASVPPDAAFLEKPFHPDALIRSIRELLARS
ncbi:MAG: hybrid sensor histidine kinase/response regulator [Longimicrobiales bacterium]